MKQSETAIRKHAGRRSFLKNSLAASAATVGVGLLSNGLSALGADHDREITEGDAAILRFLAAAEILETDLWVQYTELAGQDAPDSGYKTGLIQLDGDMPQYISDNTDDELSHELFINAYLKSKGAKPVDLETVPHSGRQPGDRHSRRRFQEAAHQPHATFRRHKLVGALPQRQQEPRSRRHVSECCPDFGRGEIHRQFPGTMRNSNSATPTCPSIHTSRPSPTRRDSTSHLSSRVEPVFMLRWHSGYPMWKFCASC